MHAGILGRCWQKLLPKPVNWTVTMMRSILLVLLKSCTAACSKRPSLSVGSLEALKRSQCHFCCLLAWSMCDLRWTQHQGPDDRHNHCSSYHCSDVEVQQHEAHAKAEHLSILYCKTQTSTRNACPHIRRYDVAHPHTQEGTGGQAITASQTRWGTMSASILTWSRWYVHQRCMGQFSLLQQ